MFLLVECYSVKDWVEMLLKISWKVAFWTLPDEQSSVQQPPSSRCAGMPGYRQDVPEKCRLIVFGNIPGHIAETFCLCLYHIVVLMDISVWTRIDNEVVKFRI